MQTITGASRTLALAVFALSLAAVGNAATVEVHLKAVPTTRPLPGGSSVAVWAYGRCTDATCAAFSEQPSVPGPRITAAPGDTLRVTLVNGLAPATSLVIPGQSEGGAPVMAGGRVRSFVQEAAAGATRVYTWPNLRPGTYLYESGTRPSVQVPMGLYGALVVSGGTYPGAPFDTDRLFLFSEIDPVQNAAVAAAGADEALYPATIDYNPKYFLVNGAAFDPFSPAASTLTVPAAGTVLLRLANAGLRPHVASIVGLDLEVRAEDGNLLPRPRRSSAVLLPPGKTHDTLSLVASDRTYSIYDRMLDLTNADVTSGGMLAYLKVGAGSPAPPAPPIAADDSYATAEDTPLVSGAPGVLANDPAGLSADDVRIQPTHGTVSLAADGSFTYTPEADYSGPDAFVYLASGAGGSTTATVRLNVSVVNDAPVARDDAYANTFGEGVQVAAPGVLANDGDPEGDTLRAVAVGDFPGLAPDGSIASGASGEFQYQACEATGASPRCSPAVTVTLVARPVRGLALNVRGVERDGATTPVADYRWLVEEDTTFHPDPGQPDGPSLGTNFHASHTPVVASGCAGGGCQGGSIGDLALDPSRHYYVSVLPADAGSGTGHSLGGAPIAPGATEVTVYVNRQPLPPAQLSVFVFEDSAPTNGAPDGNESGLGGFEIVVEDGGGRYGMNGGRLLTDKDGNLLTNALAGTPGCPASVASQPGVVITCPDGRALVKNLSPAKYGIQAVPPKGSTEGWVQTTTIEGTKVNDAWIKPNEPAYFQEFGPPGYHVFHGFVSPKRLHKPSGGANTVAGTVTNLHMSRPPDQTLHDAGTNDALAHTTAWVGLNADNGAGANIAAVKAAADGSFSIPAVPDGNYQLVVWDDYLDQIIAYRSVKLSNGSGGALGPVPVFQWFSRLENTVFLDRNEDGRRQSDEPGLIEQAVNLRFRDGSIYQTYPTDHTGFVPFDQVFPFFNWLVAEVDYTRWKPTGVTVTVDAGGAPDAGHVLNPQVQTEGCPDGEATCTSRTETGPQLLQAFQGFIGQTSVMEWGKAPYKPGENGGISGIVRYASTRAEDDPRLAAADNWEPGIPRVKVRLYKEVPANGGGAKLALVDEVKTDSWDDTLPTGCPGADPGDAAMLGPGQPLTKCYDGMRNFNQVRPGVFDGGYLFANVAPGKYVVEVVPPPGYEIVKEEDQNVGFGDVFALAPATVMLPNLGLAAALPDQALVQDAVAGPQPGIAQPICVGADHEVPPFLTLFEDQMVEAPYAGAMRPLCDRKAVVVSDQAQAAADFFLFTPTPIASHFTGMILDDLSQEFDPNSPSFGEKWAPPYVPVSVRDWTGREISRLYSDQWGRINGLVPSTFTANVPSPSGYAPNMVMTCMNDPGPIAGASGSVTDPYYDPRYTNFCYTFQYMPGTTTYLDTPVLPVSAFAAGADAPVDCAQPDKTPVIRQVNGNGAPGPFVNPTVGRTLTILSEGPARVPNPAYDGPGGSQPKTVLRDHGFGACKGQVTLGGLTIPAGNVSSWSDAQITVAIPTLGFADPTTAELKVTRCEGTTTVAGITVTISSRAIDQPVRVQAGQSISDRIAAAPAGALVLVEPGSYDELVVMAKPVRLQGSGALSTVINAVKRPAEKLEQWRARIDALVAAGAIDPLPGQTFAGGGLEPTTLGTEEGAGITVLAPDVSPIAFFDPRYANRFRQSVPYSNLFPALYFTQARIDGLTVTGGDTGGGIFVNGWAHFLQITNNRVSGNEGYHHGGIRVGRPFLDLDAQAGGYGFNRSVRIANNVVTQNGALEGAEGAGVSICTGSDSYQLTDNWICGNFSQGDGGGAAHFGRSDNGQIARNRILFNQSFSQGLTKSGGGLYVAGEPAAAGGVSNGAGRNLVIDANLVQGNQAGAGHGGGIRLEYVNGGDRSLNCNLNAPSATSPNACFWVRLTNNVVVDNVAGWSGGGISLLDAAKVDIFNNTIAHNDTTATVGALFVGSPNTSTPQPAGISAERHSLGLAALVPGTANDFSNPRLVNNVLWQNRAFYYDQSNGTGLLYPNLSGAPLSCPSGADYWDLGVLDPSLRLAPTYSLLTALSQHGVTYSGPGNVSGSPAFVADYCNGARSARLAPEVTTIQVAPALDEGGNWLDVRYGPITLTGDYHLNVGSAANNIGRGSATGLVIPSTDFDGQNRPRGGGYDAGADERWP